MSKTVAAVVKLIDNFSDPSKQVAKAARDMEKRISHTGQTFKNFGAIFESAGSSLTQAFTLPLATAAAGAGKFAMDAEDSYAQFAAATGTSAAEMEKYQSVINDIYKGNFGESIGDVSGSLATVNQNLKNLDPSALQQSTEYALAMRDVFGVEVAKSTRSADALMKNFGVTSKEAFNLMTQGAQSGLNFSDELYDNMNEYSVHFKKLGLDAEDMFSIYSSGADAGAWNLDKIGDAVKEFSIRSIDGSSTTAEGFKMIGLNADEMASKIAAGGDGASQAFDQTIQALAKIEDPVKQNAAGVALFGTMWEDLGPQVVTSLTTARGEIDKTKNSADALAETKFDTFSSALSGLWRTIQVDVLQPIGDMLIPYVEIAIDKVHSLVDWWNGLGDAGQKTAVKIAGFVGAVGPVLLAVGKLSTGFGGLVKDFGKVRGALTKLTGAKGFGAFKTFMTGPVGIALAGIATAAFLIYKNWDRIGPVVKKAIDKFKEFSQNIKALLGPEIETIKQIGSIIMDVFGAAFQTAFSIAGNLLATFFDLAGGVFGGFLTTLQGVIKFIKGVFTGDWELAWQGVKDIFKGLWEGFSSIVKAPLNAVIGVLNGFIDGINGFIDGLPDAVKSGIEGLFGSYHIPTIPQLATGTNYWQGGVAQVHEKGGEIIDLPRGTRVYPHDESIEMARAEGKKTINVNIPKLADYFVVREEADIRKVAQALVDELDRTGLNMA